MSLKKYLLISAVLLIPSSASVTAQGSGAGNPLVITKGGTYRGTWQSLNPKVPAVTIKTSEPVVIENSVIRGRGDLISGYWVNLTVRNTKGYGLNPMANGAFPGRFIQAEDVLNLNVSNNYLEGTSGIYINIFQGKADKGQTIKVLRNRIKNIDGRYVDSSGQRTGQRYLVQALQLNKIRDVPGIEVAWNEIINEPGKSFVEENINVYGTSGTSTSPILIHDNYIFGAYPFNPGKDTKYSGGGIMLGDGVQKTMATAGGYVNVYRNQVVNTSNQGIGISGGHHHNVYENRILTSGRLADGTVVPTTNVGIYMWDYQGGAKQNPKTFFNNSVRDNLIGWRKIDQDGKASYNNLWLPSCTKDLGGQCQNNKPWPGEVTPATEKAEFAFWQQKLQEKKVSIGPVE